jgi:hypothetical protein
MSAGQTFVSFGQEIDPNSRCPKLPMSYPDQLLSDNMGIVYRGLLNIMLTLRAIDYATFDR